MGPTDDSARHDPAADGPPGGPQLTLRALLVGALLGALLCLSNLYVALKTGWSLGLTVTAAVTGWAFWRGLRAVGIARRPFGILENNAACSVASSAGFMAGGGNLAALPALWLLTGAVPSWGWMALWFALTAALGIFAALPLKRRLIEVEALPFPTGTATAEALRALHGDGGGVAEMEARDAAGSASRRMAAAAVAGAVLAWLRESRSRLVPLHLPGLLPVAGPEAARYTIGLEPSLLLVGAGALMSLRTAATLVAGALVHYGVISPWLVRTGVVAAPSYRALLSFSVWPAAALLLVAALTGLLADGARLGRALRPVPSLLGARGAGARRAGECPAWWSAAAFAVLAPPLGALMVRLFGLPWWSVLVALPLALWMALVAARATGETDVTPTQALGPAVQLAFGWLVPARAVTAGLVGANLVAGAGLHAADLLTDLKAGHLLGARPRAQLAAQLLGAAVGALVVAPAFFLLVPDPSALGSAALPAPSAMVWMAVAEAMDGGLAGVPASARTAAAICAALGALLVLLERWLGEARARWLPSPTGLGIALLLPASSSAALFLGALWAWAAARRHPERRRAHVTPIASGLIAGESLAAVLG